MTGERLTRMLSILSLMAGCGFLLLNPLRLAFVANTLIPFLYFNLIVMIGCGVWFLCKVRSVNFRGVELVLCLLVLATALFTEYEGRRLVDVLTDLLRPLLFIAVVVVFRNFVSVERLNESIKIAKWLRLTMWVTVIVVPLSWAISRYIQPLYPAYASIDSVFGMAWLLGAGGFLAQVGYFALLVASGKRGVYLAAFIVILICYKNKKLTLPAWLVVALAGVLAMAAFVLFIDDVQQFLLKGGTVTSNDGLEGLINILSGGRIEEFRGALAGMTSSLQFVFGAGLGFAYPVEGFGEEGLYHRNLHFTPASLAIYYGVPFLLTFLYYLGTFFFAALRVVKSKPGIVVYCYSLYCLASMVFLFTEFSVFAYVNFAISCGVVAAADKALKRL